MAADGDGSEEPLGLISASALRTDPDNSAPVEFPAAADSQPDNMCARRQLKVALAGAMKGLPERYQKVVLLYYTNLRSAGAF